MNVHFMAALHSWLIDRNGVFFSASYSP